MRWCAPAYVAQPIDRISGIPAATTIASERAPRSGLFLKAREPPFPPTEAAGELDR